MLSLWEGLGEELRLMKLVGSEEELSLRLQKGLPLEPGLPWGGPLLQCIPLVPQTGEKASSG